MGRRPEHQQLRATLAQGEENGTPATMALGEGGGGNGNGNSNGNGNGAGNSGVATTLALGEESAAGDAASAGHPGFGSGFHVTDSGKGNGNGGGSSGTTAAPKQNKAIIHLDVSGISSAQLHKIKTIQSGQDHDLGYKQPDGSAVGARHDDATTWRRRTRMLPRARFHRHARRITMDYRCR